MKKQEFIEKYGIEAYQQHLEKVRKYREEHKNEIKEYKRKYRETHADECKESNRKWLETHKEEKREYYRKWREENPDYDRRWYKENLDYYRNYRKKHAEEIKEYHSNTKRGRANNLLQSYKQNDRKQNRGKCTLTPSWIVDKIFSSSCVYCGESDWHKLGCDRINNNLPHTEDNVVCSCWNCNNERKTTDFNEFLEKKKG